MRYLLPLLLLLLPIVTRAAIPDEKIKIGVLQDLAQPFDSETEDGGIVAAQLAAGDFDTKSLRLDAEILPAASHGNLQADLAQVRDWLDKEDVAAIVSSASDDVNRQIARLMEMRHRTLLVAEAVDGSPSGFCSAATVTWGAGDAARLSALAAIFAAQNKKRWYLVAAQDPPGVATQAALQQVVTASGGRLVGQGLQVVGSLGFSKLISAIDQAKPDVTVLSASDGDLMSILRNLTLTRTKNPVVFAAPYAQIRDIDEAGPSAASGLVIPAPFYWDTNARTRSFSRRWTERMQGQHATENAAEVYAAVLSFLHAAAAVNDVDSRKVELELRRAPLKDTLFGTASVRADGRVVYDLDVYRVKRPDQIQQRWAYYSKIATVPGHDVFPAGTCAADSLGKRAAFNLPPAP